MNQIILSYIYSDISAFVFVIFYCTFDFMIFCLFREIKTSVFFAVSEEYRDSRISRGERAPFFYLYIFLYLFSYMVQGQPPCNDCMLCNIYKKIINWKKKEKKKEKKRGIASSSRDFKITREAKKR